MLARFFSSQTPQDPFLNSETFAPIHYYLTALRNKAKELKALDKNNPDKNSIACQKYRLVSELVEQIAKEIAYFNRAVGQDKSTSNLKNELDLSVKLLAICIKAMSYYTLLATQRNDQRQWVDESVKWMAGMTIFSIIALPISLVTGVVVIGGVVITTEIMRHLTGLNDSRAYSAYLLVELTKHVITIHLTLENQQKRAVLAGALRIFNLETDVSAEEVRARYRKLALTCHPDRYPAREEQFKELTNAYETLLKHIESDENTCTQILSRTI